jgi:hypothetical protein
MDATIRKGWQQSNVETKNGGQRRLAQDAGFRRRTLSL